MCDPETLQLVPRADDWVVNFIRHKKRETFFIEGKYMVTVTTVKEHDVNWKEMRPGDSINVKPEDYNEPHMEVEVRPVVNSLLGTYLRCLYQTICQSLSTDKCICWPILHSLIPRLSPPFFVFVCVRYNTQKRGLVPRLLGTRLTEARWMQIEEQ